MCIKAICSFMLCSFGISTEASAPAVLSLYHITYLVVILDRDNLDRKLQAHAVAELLANATNPIVMLSYVTDRHGSRDYKTIVEKGNVNVSFSLFGWNIKN